MPKAKKKVPPWKRMDLIDGAKAMALLRAMNDYQQPLPTDDLIRMVFRRTLDRPDLVKRTAYLKVLERLTRRNYVWQDGQGVKGSAWSLTRAGQRAAVDGTAIHGYDAGAPQTPVRLSSHRDPTNPLPKIKRRSTAF